MSRRWLEWAALAVALAIVTVMLTQLAGVSGLVLANGQPMFGDFISFWSAGRAALDGHIEQIHDRQLIFSYHQLAAPGARFVAWWNSPPTFLLIVAPLALLPYPAAALVFLAGSGALFFFAARKLLPDARALIFAAMLPAALFHLGTVQTGLLIAGVSGLALYWLDRRPLAAGALVSVLAIKPHLALLWPLMLALSGRWRAFAAATVSTLVFVGLAALAFGPLSFVRFFEHLVTAQTIVAGQLLSTPAYASLYGNLLSAGMPPLPAAMLHSASALAAVVVAAWLFRCGDREISGAALCAATLLISPYLFFYDFTLLAVGATLLGVPRDRFESVALIAAWCAGLSLPLGYLAPVPLGPAAAWCVLIAAMRRSGSAASAPAPALRT